MKRLLVACLLIGSICVSAQEKFTVYFDFDIHELPSGATLKLSDWLLQNKQLESQTRSFSQALSTVEVTWLWQ